MKGGTFVVVLLMLAATLPLTSVAAAPRGPIFISSNAAFTAANGVIGGAGTPADPYVIGGWSILPTIGTAIEIKDVTASFVVRDNILGGDTGLKIRNATGTILVEHNQFQVKAGGAVVRESDAIIRENSFTWATPHGNFGVVLDTSSSLVLNNTFDHIQWAIQATRGSPQIVGNDIHFARIQGILVEKTTQACIRENILTTPADAIFVRDTIQTCIYDNTIVGPKTGISVWISKDTDVRRNLVRGATVLGAAFESTSGNFTHNVLVDGEFDGFHVWHSAVEIEDNRFENNMNVALYFMMGSANATRNVLVSNGVGILVADGPTTVLRFNVLVDNFVGMSIPYPARQTIHWMHGNLVNGINVDGTLVPSEKVYHYREANVVISGQVRDSGFGAGRFGSLTAEGAVVLYDVDTATIDRTTISHHLVGVGAVNSFNVQVTNSTISQARVGVRGEGVAIISPTFPCVIGVKDSIITIPVDPPQTIGVELVACFGNIWRNEISVVDVGVRIDGNSMANVTGNTIFQTRVGLDVMGKSGEVVIDTNTLLDNRIGAAFRASDARVTDNVFVRNSDKGVTLEAASRLDFRRNNLTANGHGLVDLRTCVPPPAYQPPQCSSLVARDNTFHANLGLGAQLHGASTFEGDRFLDNGGAGARLGSATLSFVRAAGNGADGVSVDGTFSVKGSLFARNDGHGLRLVGGGTLRSSEFSWNGGAGIRATATYVTAFEINASHNLDGILFDEVAPAFSITPTYVSIPELVDALATAAAGASPMDVHRSIIVGNLRDGVRAGASAVNATHNYWGPAGPSVNVGDQVGAFRNGVSPTVRFVPYFSDSGMTTTGPAPLL